MFARDLHLVLAWASLGTMAVAATESAFRAFTNHPPGRAALLTSGAVLVLLGTTTAGGLALLALGHRPSELLHVIYAVLALAVIPAGEAMVRSKSPRRRGIERTVAGVVGLVLIVRLFATG